MMAKGTTDCRQNPTLLRRWLRTMPLAICTIQAWMPHPVFKLPFTLKGSQMSVESRSHWAHSLFSVGNQSPRTPHLVLHVARRQHHHR